MAKNVKVIQATSPILSAQSPISVKNAELLRMLVFQPKKTNSRTATKPRSNTTPGTSRATRNGSSWTFIPMKA